MPTTANADATATQRRVGAQARDGEQDERHGEADEHLEPEEAGVGAVEQPPGRVGLERPPRDTRR